MAGGGFAPGAGNGKEYPGNLTPYVIVTCVIAAMGGLIFGYDIGISGIYVFTLFLYVLYLFCVLESCLRWVYFSVF